jgi:hypothetical protein
MRHYVDATDADFERAIQGSAEYSAPGAQNSAQRVRAESREEIARCQLGA